MPHPHNHKEWDAHSFKYNDDWKEKHQAKKKRKVESDVADPPKKSTSRKLYLAKSFKSALANQVMLSDQEANQLVDDVLNGKFNEDDEIKIVPELAGTRFIYELDMCLSLFIYLFQTILIILSAFTFIVHTLKIIGREFKNTLTWMAISGIHLILIMLSSLQSRIQLTLIMILQLPLSRAVPFWLKCYYSLFKYK